VSDLSAAAVRAGGVCGPRPVEARSFNGLVRHVGKVSFLGQRGEPAAFRFADGAMHPDGHHRDQHKKPHDGRGPDTRQIQQRAEGNGR